MKISIICCFCDKDFKYLNTFLNYVDKIDFFSKAEKEVILVDNRTNKNKLNLKYNVCTYSKNTSLAEGIRAGFKESSGDYIWFIDVDDEPFNFDVCDIIDKDIYSYGYNSKEDVYRYNFISQKENFVLWNNVYKRSFVDKILTNIPYCNISACYDLLFNNIALFLNSEIKVITDKIIYKYNINNAVFKNKIDKIDNFKINSNGYECADILYNITKDHILSSRLKYDFLIVIFYNYIRCDKSIKKEAINIINDKFSMEDIKEAYIYNYRNLKLLVADAAYKISESDIYNDSRLLFGSDLCRINKIKSINELSRS